MDTNRPSARLPSGEHTLDYTEIEQGRIETPEAGKDEGALRPDDLALRIRDSGGGIGVIGRIYLEDPRVSGPAVLSVLSSHTGAEADQLALIVSLFNFLTGSYETLGTDRVTGGKEQRSRFGARFDPGDGRIGSDGEIRVRLSVFPEDAAPPADGYTYAIDGVTLRLRDEGARYFDAFPVEGRAVVPGKETCNE